MEKTVANYLESTLFQSPVGTLPQLSVDGKGALTHPLHFITLGTKGEQVHPKGKNLVQSHTEKVFFLRCLP